jgi:cytochrome c oxidase subunit IV
MSDAQGHGHDFNMVRVIWKTCGILSVITVLEIVAAILLTGHVPQLSLNIFYIVMSCAKAFYIVGTFMHLKFEMKHLIVTVLIPIIFLIYALVVLLAEGTSWHDMRAF